LRNRSITEQELAHLACVRVPQCRPFALILHAHLPFVRHPEHEHFVEEEWLFEAITETYIPLLARDAANSSTICAVQTHMSITPTLCAMLKDQLLCERYVRHLDLFDRTLPARERKRNSQTSAAPRAS